MISERAGIGKMIVRVFLLSLFVLLTACSGNRGESAGPDAPCTEEILTSIENSTRTGDASGHGPDLGSDEWHSVVEFRLGVRGDVSVPPRGTKRWCEFVTERLGNRSR